MATRSQREPGKELEALCRGALLLDLEVSKLGKILKVGAVLGDRTFARSGNRSGTMGELSRLAEGASCVLGHNLVRHDLPMLREMAARHPVLKLPVIDTLVLSPIAFPENPYHRLVKDYKLVRESVNDPVADARQAAALFADEFRSLAGLRETEPGVFELLHFLLATADAPESVFRNPDHSCRRRRQESQTPRSAEKLETPEVVSYNLELARGMEMVFNALGGTRPSLWRAVGLCRELLGRWGCKAVRVEESVLQTNQQRLAMAYTLTWLRVAGSASVLPAWVRLEHPLVGELIRRLRETPCELEECTYCRRVHNAREQLRAFFGFDDFRTLPASRTGGSLQREIAEAGLRNESLLAILPTGGGKSLCYQLPALVRNYRRGVLTIVLSPLQALMKDQVDGPVRRTGTSFAAALYGMLTPPERGDVLRRVRMGDVALLYVSPEQLRNRSFQDAIAQREIGCWVVDEAHCLSKWGHDFRPDYLYVGRFIREFSKSQGVEIPPIACFTATAKQDVKEEIIAYFKDETGRGLALFEGGVERDNLRFEVQTTTEHSKLERIHDLLSEHFARRQKGSAIVFRALRQATEESAEYLQQKGWRAAHFHAGLTPPEKKRIQDEFLAGEIQVICATNAFGMGIDKEDVRLVIHGDTPGSLENYLQEAGRAGRDGDTAECILLFDEKDCEQQFRLGAFSELSRRDIAQILRGLRKATRGDREEVVITTGEILRDEDVVTDIALQERSADTKVRTAISWLERAGFVQRDENVTSVFQARPLVRNLQEAEAKIAGLSLPVNEKALWMAILRELMNAGPAESLTVDRLALLPEFTRYAQGEALGPGSLEDKRVREKRASSPQPSPPEPERESSGKGERNLAARAPTHREKAQRANRDSPMGSPDLISAKILRILRGMAGAGLLKRDTLLNAFVRHKVADSSRLQLERVLQLDRKLLDLLQVEEPDPEGWMPLSLRLLNQRLCDEGVPSSTELIRSLLKSLSEDGRGFAGMRGSIDLRFVAWDMYRVRVNRTWANIQELAEKRRRVSAVVLEALVGKIPAETPASAELLVEFSFEELQNAVESDLLLRSELKDMEAALERALMYLHEQHVIVLQQGLAVFRSAMKIRLQPEAKRKKYAASDYQPLEHHYRERILQVHVMSEYARRGLERVQEALGLVLAYFTLEKEAFIRRYLGTKPELLKHATTARSYQRIVTDLGNPAQVEVVTAPVNRNMLILAGPGSGKTRTVVHRCAYLLRVERVRPQSVLVCCFNRNAALELRRRLAELAGDDARGVTVLTYHGLAMRLLGYSFAGRSDPRSPEPDFDALITEAVKLLRGEKVAPGLQADEVRERLLAGFQHILVDEYQDIDQPQYEMISAIAGRRLEDADLKLSILAVGDDDQNIYSFRGANVQFIRRFQQDYEAKVHYLVENYRSTRNIIEAANPLIAANVDRMKREHPIRIDRHRETLPEGGEFGQRDSQSQGKVQVVRVRDSASQARAVLGEIDRLRKLGVSDWPRMAVLSSTHRDLVEVRALAEREKIPVRWHAGQNATPPLHQVREIDGFLRHLAQSRSAPTRATDLLQAATRQREADPRNPWLQFLCRMLEGCRNESGDAEQPAQEALEFLYESCAESRRDFTYGDGAVLNTVHAAKGTEYDHVLLIGPWPLRAERARQEEQRRAFYVGMTRARETVAVFDRGDVRPSLPQTLTGPAIWRRSFEDGVKAEPSGLVNYAMLGLEDIHLSYAGRFTEGHPVHAALVQLRPDDRLTMKAAGAEGLGLFDRQGICVARLSRKAVGAWRERVGGVREVRVLALVHRGAEQEVEPERRSLCRVTEWEIPVVEVVFEEGG